MKRNRKIPKKVSVMTTNSISIGAIVVLILAMVITNQLASASCSQMLRVLGEKERELRRQEDACVRESSRWEEMKTPEKIEAALLRHGLRMSIPRPDQFVRMRADGTPVPGQLAVIRARHRLTALNGEPSAPESGYRRKRR